jgi:hypothetical protein
MRLQWAHSGGDRLLIKTNKKFLDRRAELGLHNLLIKSKRIQSGNPAYQLSDQMAKEWKQKTHLLNCGVVKMHRII